MPKIAPRPTSIDAVNAPHCGPTGYGYSKTDISPQELASGVCVFADKQRGGAQVVQAILGYHYERNDEQFFVISEKPVYERLQINAAGNPIEGRPVYTVRPDEVIDDIAAAILAEAFRDKQINIEYPIAMRTQERFAPEIRRLADAIITSGAEDFTTGIDNGDSATKRKRHGYDSPMIRSMSDLFTRQEPVMGFVYASSGPGSSIIEMLRRCEVPVGKMMKTQDALLGFAALTTGEVRQQADRMHGHRHVEINHAWKYNGNQPQANPDLLDLPLSSAILTTGNHTVQEGKAVKKLRTKIKSAQAEAAEANKALPTSRRGRQPVANRTVEPNAVRPAGEVIAKLDRKKRTDGSISKMISALGGKNHIVSGSIVHAATSYGIMLPGMPMRDDAASLAAWGAGEDVRRLANMAHSARQRTGIDSAAAMSIVAVLLEAVDPVNGKAFFDDLNRNPDLDTPGNVAVRRIAGATKQERTTHRIADYLLQAWDAHATGRPLTHFVDRAELTMPIPHKAKTALEVDSANDNTEAALPKAA